MLKITLAGNLGKDAELREVNGQNVISFSVAISENYTNKEGVKVEKTLWINCAKWQDKSARTGLVQYLKRGSKVIVEGVPEVNIWRDKENMPRADLKCRVKEIHLLSSTLDKPLSASSSEAPAVQSSNELTPAADDLPF